MFRIPTNGIKVGQVDTRKTQNVAEARLDALVVLIREFMFIYISFGGSFFT